MSTLRVFVELECGCSFREHRPEGLVPPVDGELRACGDMEHYPRQYRATYSQHEVVTKDQAEQALKGELA